MDTETKYALYVVLLEDTNEAYTNLAQNVDTVETIALDLTYDEAMDKLQEKAWG